MSPEPVIVDDAPAAQTPEWTTWPDETLLDLRICDLGVTIAGSVLESRFAELQRELDARNLTFQPHFWLSAEWFSPDGVPGVAVPFYLAHPRLEKIGRASCRERVWIPV